MSSVAVGLTGDLRDQVESFSSGVSKQVEGVSEGINKQVGGVTGLAGDALQDAASQLNSAKEAAAKAVAAVGEQFLDQTATAVSGLPPPVRDTVYAAAAVLSKVRAALTPASWYYCPCGMAVWQVGVGRGRLTCGMACRRWRTLLSGRPPSVLPSPSLLCSGSPAALAATLAC